MAINMACILCLSSPSHALAAITADDSAAVIFAYQRVGEDAGAQGNISLELFRQHMQELKNGGYTVLPLQSVAEAIKETKPLPVRAVAITFDGASRLTLDNVAPVLREYGFPYTVFFASDMADGQNAGHLDWEELKKLQKDKHVTLGILPAVYQHMVTSSEEANTAIINRAVSKYREMFGQEPLFFAWPYGEHSTALEKQIATYPFLAAFGQHSGVAHAGQKMTALPRFTMTDRFGDIERFRLTANALPLPVSAAIPQDVLLSQNPPDLIGFSVTPELTDLSKLSCFATGFGKIALKKPGGNRVELRFDEPYDDRRIRINCTLPESGVFAGETPVWRWHGMLLVNPDYIEPEMPDEENSGIE